MPSKTQYHIPITINDRTALDYLSDASGLSRQKIKKCMKNGCVWLERVSDNTVENTSTRDSHKQYIQRLRRAKKVLNSHHVLHFYYDETVLSQEVTPAQLIEDLGEYSIWNKPTGMLSQGSKWGDHCTINRWVELNLRPERPAFIVHRLDRAANGLIVLAHSKKMASQFSRMFEARELDKRYRVKVEGDFSATLQGKGELKINHDIDHKVAISWVKLLEYDRIQDTSILEVNIETGRKHQIRKHLSNKGFPVLGDRLYGSHNTEVDLQLQARSLRFTCPVTSEEKYFSL